MNDRLQILEAQDQHAPLLAAFFREVWNPAATGESVLSSRVEGAAHNVSAPGIPPPTWIALQAGRVLGYVTTLPIRLWDGHLDWPAYWIKGLMVLPEFRNGPIGYAVVKAAASHLPRSGALAVAPPARRLFEALGYVDLGPIPNWILPLAPHRVLQRLDVAGLGLGGVPRWTRSVLRMGQTTRLATVLGWAGGALLRPARAVMRLSAIGHRAGRFETGPNAPGLDGLWARARDGLGTSVVRDSRYLLRRYGSKPDGRYTWVAVRKEGDLSGAAVLRRPRDDDDERFAGIRVAVLADLLYDPRDGASGLALLGAVERAARELEADAILASASSPALGRLLRRQCYLPLPGNVHLLFRNGAGSPELAGSLADWWLTRGDGAADDAF